MVQQIQAANPQLLAALSKPNVNPLDFQSIMAQTDLNRAQRQKIMAEMALLPAQQKNESLKNQAYLLQQGYTIDPVTGRPVMTPAKQAELAAYQAYANGGQLPQMMQRMNDVMQPQQQPALPQVDPINNPVYQGDQTSSLTPGEQGQPSSSGYENLFGPSDSPAVPEQNDIPSNPGDQFAQGGNTQMDAIPSNPQSVPQAPLTQMSDFMARSQQLIEQGNKQMQLGGIVGNPQMSASGKSLVDQGLEMQKMQQAQQKIQQDTPEYQGQQAESKKQAELSAQSNFDTYNSIKTQYQADNKQAIQLNQIESMFDKGLKTGKIEEAVLPMRKYLVAANLANKNTVDQIGLQEGMTALGNQLALRLRNPESGMGLTGNTSDRDVTFLLDGIETLGKTPQGNRLILDMQKASMNHNSEQFKYIAKLRSENGGRLPADFDQKLVEWNDVHPVFNDRASKDLIGKAQKVGLKTPEEKATDFNKGPISYEEYFK